MILRAQVSTTRLNVYLKDRVAKLQVNGQLETRKQAGLLQEEVMKGANPQNLQKAKARAEKDVKKSFYGINVSQTFKGAKAGEKHGSMVWLYASPKALVGVERKNLKTGVGAAQMMPLYRKQQKSTAGAFARLGKRGNQHVMKVLKPVVKKTEAKRFAKVLQDSFGKLKASFVKGAKACGARFRIPSWVSKHLGDARGNYVDRTNNRSNPTFTMISEATGCTARASLKNINRACTKRAFAMKKDMENQLRGLYRKP